MIVPDRTWSFAIRVITDALGNGVKQVYPGELAAMKKLRRVSAVLGADPQLVSVS